MTDVLDGLDEPATETAEAPAPEVVEKAPEPEAPKVEAKEDERFVPLKVMLEERKNLQAKLAEREAREKELEERLARLEKGREPEEKLPDFLDDPKAYVDKAVEKIQKAAEATKAETAEMKAAREREEGMQRFMSAVQADEAAFIQKSPDYLNAVSFLREQRAAELEFLYPEIPKAQIMGQIAQEEIALANRAVQAQKSPAEMAYEYAKRRGYKLPEAPKAEVPKNVTPINPAAALTLGSGGGSGDSTPTEEDDGLGQFDAALREVFGKR